MSEAPAPIEEAPSIPDVVLLDVNPSLNNAEMARKVFDAVLKAKPKALVLEVYGSGSSPKVLDPLIQECVEQGVSVFLLSKNPGDEKGIQNIKYEAQEGAVEAGAVPLRDVNVRHTQQVLTTIQSSINQGNTGPELNKAIIKQFGTSIPTPTK